MGRLDKTLREVCETKNLLEQVINLEVIEISPLQMVSNLSNIMNLHIFHVAMGLYILMILTIMKHRSALSGRFTNELFTKEEMQERKLDAILRRETQLYVNRAETRLYTNYLVFLSILFVNICGWVCSQILDIHNLTGIRNVYRIKTIS